MYPSVCLEGMEIAIIVVVAIIEAVVATIEAVVATIAGKYLMLIFNLIRRKPCAPETSTKSGINIQKISLVSFEN